MLKTPIFLGFSTVRRNNRRLLVAVTYAAFLALMGTAIIIVPSRGRDAVVWVCVTLVYSVASGQILGRFVKDTVLPEIRGGEMTSLGLTPRRHRGEDEPDERDVAVRNAAYFEAYRALAVYSIIVWATLPLISELSASTALRLLQLLALPLVMMALTLPQAVVLWTEPDVPEEARV